MRKKVNWLRHFSILFLTVLIFTIGIFIGGSVEEARVQNLYTQLQEQDLEYQNIATEKNYIDYLVDLKEGENNLSCRTIQGAYYTSITNLGDARIKLEAYINKAQVKGDEYDRLKSHYSNLQIDYWILANKISNLCTDEGTQMNTVLYFYADKKSCPTCEDQGVHLSYVKSKLGDNVLVFSLDSQSNGVIKLISQKYKVNENELPMLVINGESYGYKSNGEIFDILCEQGLEDKVCNV